MIKKPKLNIQPIYWEFDIKERPHKKEAQKDNTIDYSETGYSELEESQVIQEIRWGLIRQEITSSVTKRELLDWFAKVSIPKREWCENITCLDLFYIATECGINIIDLEG